MTTKQLNVPLLRQGEGTTDCGPTCVSMILKYYGIENDVEEVTREIRRIDKKMILPADAFTYTPQLGLYFLKQGFEAEIVTFNPFIFNYTDRLSPNGALLKRMQDYWEKLKRRRKISIEIKRPAKFFVDFMENGGKVRVKVPDESDIREEIKSSRPLLALMTTNFLYKKPKGRSFNFHANVITGIDKTHIYANDPLANSNGGRKRYLIDEYIFGIHASAYGAPDNAALLKIKR